MAQLDTERELRARIAELEAKLDARTQVIVSLGAQLAEVRGNPSPTTAERLREAERQLDELRNTKVLRYTASARRVYGMLRGGRG